MRRSGKSKTKSLMIHTQRRILQRYGCWLEKSAVEALAEICRKNEFFCHLRRQSLTKSRIVVKRNGHLIPLIYDKKRHCIVTVLTMDMLSADERVMVERAEYCSA